MPRHRSKATKSRNRKRRNRKVTRRRNSRVSKRRSKIKDKGTRRRRSKTTKNAMDSKKLDIKGENYLIIENKKQKGSKKIAAFDLDHTLIKTKSGNVFPKDYKDWVFFNDFVVETLQKLRDSDYKIVVFTNQSGSKFKADDFEKKIKAISDQSVPLQVFVSTDYGYYRKPSIGMWSLLEENNDGKKIDRKKSFYVGDAAGRVYSEKGKKKDFSDSDLKFARNLGIDFYVPETYFSEEKELFEGTPEHPLDKYAKKKKPKIKSSEEQEMIILMGPPASGKSTITKNKKFKDYVVACQDDLGTKAKVIKVVKNALKDGKSVIVDRKNEYVKYRKEFIDIANEFEVPVRLFWFDIPKELSEHLNAYRTIMTGKRIPTLVFNKYFSETKGYEEPTLKEGFEEIIKVPFVIKEKEIENPDLFYSFLV